VLQHPTRRVVFITFSDEVTVFGDGSQDPQVIVGDKLLDYDGIVKLGVNGLKFDQLLPVSIILLLFLSFFFNIYILKKQKQKKQKKQKNIFKKNKKNKKNKKYSLWYNLVISFNQAIKRQAQIASGRRSYSTWSCSSSCNCNSFPTP
jgi:hypothetical protein